jgi:hypothetical protein
MNVSGNDNRFKLTGQTAENRIQKMVGTWTLSGPIAPIMFGNALIRLIILNSLPTLTDLFITRLT